MSDLKLLNFFLRMDRRKLALVAYYAFFLEKKRRKKRAWQKPWLGDYQRLKNSFVFNLEPHIRDSGPDDFKYYTRLPPAIYESILEKVTPFLTKSNTNVRLAVTPREKLSITLAFLAEGKK